MHMCWLNNYTYGCGQWAYLLDARTKCIQFERAHFVNLAVRSKRKVMFFTISHYFACWQLVTFVGIYKWQITEDMTNYFTHCSLQPGFLPPHVKFILCAEDFVTCWTLMTFHGRGFELVVEVTHAYSRSYSTEALGIHGCVGNPNN